MGQQSGMFALDVDGPEGRASLAKLTETHGPLPTTLEQRTGRGVHYFFRFPQTGATIRNGVSKIGQGLDVRGEGGYIIVAPSVHPNGSNYCWVADQRPSQMEPADAPPWLLDLVVVKPSPEASERPEWKSNRSSTRYADAALDREAEAVARAPEGQRNDRLNTAAFSVGRLVGSGVLPEERVVAVLTQAALHAGLDAIETAKTIKSGMSSGTVAPRDVAERGSRSKIDRPQPQPDDQAQAEVVEAKSEVADLPLRAKADIGAPFEPDALRALNIIRAKDIAHFQRVRDDLKQVGVRMRDLDRALKTNQRLTIETSGTDDDGATERAGLYSVINGAICRLKDTQEGLVTVPLCNFDVRIVGEEVRDDGAEQVTVFVVEGTLQDGSPLPRTEVLADRFTAMNWVTPIWGTAPVVYAGQGTKDHLRAAIQLLSGEVPRSLVYGHFGWRKSGENWFFLHSDGAIGPDGPDSMLKVLAGETQLTCYTLPEPPMGDELKIAIRTSLSALELAPTKISYPLLAAVYRAPLGEVAPVDLSVFIAGPTGSQKTEITAIAQAHYGASFNGRCLPGNWETTANSLEKQAFLAKDVIFTVDDFVPKGTMADVQRLHRDADRLLRGQGNRAGRGRMRPDGTIRPAYFPRGIIISSGEDIPRGQSLRSRNLILEVSRGEVDLDRLTKLQNEATQGLLALAVAGYVSWLAPQVETLKTQMPKRLRALRADARELPVFHDRTPDIIASLAAGWEVFLDFAVETEAITDAEQHSLWEEAWQALLEVAEAQAGFQANEEPASRFLTLLRSAIASGQAHVADPKSSNEPAEPANWGWRQRTGQSVGQEWQSNGPLVGWLDGDDLLLDPDASFAAAQRLARDQGGALTITAQTLWKRMVEQGVIVSRDDKRGRNTIRKSVGRLRRSVIHIYADTFLPSKSGPSGPKSQKDADAGSIGPHGPQMGHMRQSTDESRMDDLDSKNSSDPTRWRGTL